METKVTEAKVTWKGNMAFTGSAGSEYEVPLDAKLDVGGEGKGFRPMQLIAMGLAGCTAMDVISILRKKRQEVVDFEVEVHGPRAEEHPRVFTSATIDYHITGRGVDEAAVVRSIELSAVRYCPAQAMFGQVFPMQLKYHIYEVGEAGQRTLVTSGEYEPDRKISQIG